jgi:hypothetical protein
MTADGGSGIVEHADTKSCGKRALAAIAVMSRINVCLVIARKSMNPICGIKIDKVTR